MGLSCFILVTWSKSMKSDSYYDYSWAIEAVKPMQIKEYLSVLAAEPHLAGLERDEYLANWIADTWRNLSLDEVKLDT